MSKPVYVWGFPGVGKTSLTSRTLTIVDADCTQFQFLPPDIPNSALHSTSNREGLLRQIDYPNNYLRYLAEQTDDLVLINCHPSLLSGFDPERLLLVYPEQPLKDVYLRRYLDRGDHPSFIRQMDETFDSMLDYLAHLPFRAYRITEPDTTLQTLLDGGILSLGFTDLASGQKCYKLPPAFRDLLQSMRHKTVTVPKDELSRELQPKIEHCKTNLLAWINGEKPKNLTPELEERWEKTTNVILASADKFTGTEYMQSGKGRSVKTMPEIELLSQIRKSATIRSIPRNVKQQIVLWARSLKEYESKVSSLQPADRLIETDFYKGSKAFDGQYTRMGHGYWSSECEMFARAFDCYISDKLKEDARRASICPPTPMHSATRMPKPVS